MGARGRPLREQEDARDDDQSAEDHLATERGELGLERLGETLGVRRRLIEQDGDLIELLILERLERRRVAPLALALAEQLSLAISNVSLRDTLGLPAGVIILLFGGSVLMFVVKGGTVAVLIASFGLLAFWKLPPWMVIR